MTRADATSPAVEPDAGAALAVTAWERLCLRLARSDVPPTAVVRLKRQRHAWHKSAVYWLDGVGDGGEPVVGKRCLRVTARVEREVYEKVLPRIPIRQLKYYGCVEEEQGPFAWLFMEEAPSGKPTMADRGIIASWLARLHGSAAQVTAEDSLSLPDHGPDGYLRRLPAARAAVVAEREAVAGAGLDGRVLGTMADLLDRLESRWDQVAAACAAWPRTIVHTDFTRKNVRLFRSDTGTDVIALDWEAAGWGPPAADLAAVPWGRSRDRKRGAPAGADHETPWSGPVSLDAYASTAATYWPGIGRDDVERISRVGAVFRVIDATRWASQNIEFGGFHKGLGHIRAYVDDLMPNLAALGL